MAGLRLRTLNTADRAILVARGDIDLNTAALLDAKLNQLTSKYRKLEVNLNGTNYVDSTGLASLLRAHKYLDMMGGEFCITGCQPLVSRILHLVGFNNLFSISEHEPRSLRIPEVV